MGTPRPIVAMISVQSPGGLVFGTATRIDGMTISFDLEARMDAGEVVEFRIELPGLEETAMGTLRITSGRKGDAGASSFLASIQTLVPDDAEIFEVWRRGVEQGTRAFSHSSRAPTDSWLKSTTMVGSTEAERRLAVASQEDRRKRRLENAKHLARNSRAWPDPEDLAGGRVAASGAFRASLSRSASRSPASHSVGNVTQSGSSVGTGDRPRTAVADALRQGFGAIPWAVATPAAPATAPTSPDAAPAVREPTVHVDNGMASVTFQNDASWRGLHRPSLLSGMLVFARKDLGVAGTELKLFLILPNGSMVMADGTVLAVSASHTELQVRLAAPALKMVEHA